MIRACAALSPASACTELCGGIAYYRWLRELEQDFDARAEVLINTLQTLTERLFVKARLLCSVTGTKKAAETVNGLMAIPNLTALAILTPEVVRLTKEYRKL